jgi:oligosaccharide repeat unit polymerase
MLGIRPETPVTSRPGIVGPTPRTAQALYGEVALHAALAVTAAGAMFAMSVGTLPLIVLVALVMCSLDFRNPLTLRNFVLLYTLALFGVGASYLHLSGVAILSDAVWYTIAFLVGYVGGSLPGFPRRRTGSSVGRPPGRGALRIVDIESALFVLIILNLLMLAYQFSRYGIVGYYQGRQLLDQALTYGKASTVSGAEQIVRFGLSDSGIALVVLYVTACFESKRAIRYRYPVALFLAVPILSLDRFDAVIGAFTLLAIYACDRRLSPGSQTRANAVSSVELRISRKRGRGAVILFGLVLALVTSIFVADLRSGFTNKSGGVPGPSDRVAMFTSEFEPVQAYEGIKANITILGHPHGRTIIWPLLLKVVPRAWDPNKPLNSGAYYMSIVRPKEWQAGYALPPTMFGDAYLNFGFGGALILCFVVGVAAARLDQAYKHSNMRGIAAYLLVFASCYAILRDPLSDGLAALLLTMNVWAVGNRVFRASAPILEDEINSEHVGPDRSAGV